MDSTLSVSPKPGRALVSRPPQPSRLATEELRLNLLPLDLFFMIRDELLIEDPDAVCCLALTCKQLFGALVRPDGRLPRVAGHSRTFLLSLLERELGREFYLCHQCAKLHRCFRSWGPTRPGRVQKCVTRAYQYPTARPVRIDRLFEYALGFHHVRLVMMNHFYGDAKGIPLRNLEKVVTVPGYCLYDKPKTPACGAWRQEWSAQIISHELFLRADHTLEACDEEQLRQALDVAPCHYDICNHVSMYSENTARGRAPWSVWHLTRLALLPNKPLLPCQDVRGSCRWCLTDYTLALERPEAEEPASKESANSGAVRRISISAYHHVGDGVSPEDPKWRAFAGETAKLLRDPRVCPPDWVRETWNTAGVGRSLPGRPFSDMKVVEELRNLAAYCPTWSVGAARAYFSDLASTYAYVLPLGRPPWALGCSGEISNIDYPRDNQSIP